MDAVANRRDHFKLWVAWQNHVPSGTPRPPHVHPTLTIEWPIADLPDPGKHPFDIEMTPKSRVCLASDLIDAKYQHLYSTALDKKGKCLRTKAGCELGTLYVDSAPRAWALDMAASKDLVALAHAELELRLMWYDALVKHKDGEYADNVFKSINEAQATFNYLAVPTPIEMRESYDVAISVMGDYKSTHYVHMKFDNVAFTLMFTHVIGGWLKFTLDVPLLMYQLKPPPHEGALLSTIVTADDGFKMRRTKKRNGRECFVDLSYDSGVWTLSNDLKEKITCVNLRILCVDVSTAARLSCSRELKSNSYIRSELGFDVDLINSFVGRPPIPTNWYVLAEEREYLEILDGVVTPLTELKSPYFTLLPEAPRIKGSDHKRLPHQVYSYTDRRLFTNHLVIIIDPRERDIDGAFNALQLNPQILYAQRFYFVRASLPTHIIIADEMSSESQLGPLRLTVPGQLTGHPELMQRKMLGLFVAAIQNLLFNSFGSYHIHELYLGAPMDISLMGYSQDLPIGKVPDKGVIKVRATTTGVDLDLDF